MGGDFSQFYLPEEYGNPAAHVNKVDQSKKIVKDHDVPNKSKECGNPDEDVASGSRVDQTEVNDSDHDVQNASQECVEPADDADSVETIDQSKVLDEDHNPQNTYPERVEQNADGASLQIGDHTQMIQSYNVHNYAPRVEKSRIPGRPGFSDVGIDNITLVWREPEDTDVDYYEIKFKQTGAMTWCKTSVSTNDAQTRFRVDSLRQDTEYEFKVRAHYRNHEGELSEKSKPTKTKKSEASYIRRLSHKLEDGSPGLYRLPLVLIRGATCEERRTRKYVIGNSTHVKEKTIMMIGATGAGKSTLIDGMMNYLLGVKWEDNFRFQLIDSMDDAQTCLDNQTQSQTSWITSYRIHPLTDTVDFIINIIDTPGFGDTKGLEADHMLVDQITYFFKTAGEHGMETIDAVCFVAQAPSGRLTCTQRYINDSILKIFGKDIADNIVAMVTFVDGKEPPVLRALSEADVPIRKHFEFNNSALFASNVTANGFTKMFWEMGVKSYNDFFDFLPSFKTQSLQLTADILRRRERVLVVIEGLKSEIDKGLVNLETIQQERYLLNRFESQIKDNENFKYTTKEWRQQKNPLKPKEHVTNCLHCNMTCHYPCNIPNDEDKKGCAAIDRDTGKCKICPDKCDYSFHKNNDFRIESYTVEVEKTYNDMKSKYEFAKENKITKEKWIAKIKKAFLALKDSVCSKLKVLREESNYLREHAIKSNPLSEIEYIDLLIEQEKIAKQPGYTDRLRMLDMIQKNAELAHRSITIDDPNELLRQIGWKETTI
ncbi:hypothetical protein ScPMuIL_017602 [Solemya velum]